MLSQSGSQVGSGGHPHSPAPGPQPIVLLAPTHPLLPRGKHGWKCTEAPCQPPLYQATLAQSGRGWIHAEQTPSLFTELPVPETSHHIRERCPGAWNLQISEGSGYSLTVQSRCPLLAPCPASFPFPGWVEPRWCLFPGSEDFPSPVSDTSGTMETQACLNSHESYSETWARLGSQCRHHRPKIAPSPSLSPHMTLHCPHQHGLCITCKLHNVGCRQDPTGRGTRKGSSSPTALGKPSPLSGPQLLRS